MKRFTKIVAKIFMLTLLLSTPAYASPFLIQHVTGVGKVNDVFVTEAGVVYLASINHGITSLSADGSGSLKTIGRWNSPQNEVAYSREILVKDNVLILAQRENGTKFIDISDPANPTLITTIDNPVSNARSRSSRLAIDGNMLYISSVQGGLTRVDISNMQSPRVLDTITFPGKMGGLIESQGISVYGDLVFVATPWEGWSIVDYTSGVGEIIASFNKPDFEGSLASRGAWDVEVANGYAYVLIQDFGVEIYDVRDTANVSKISEYRIDKTEGFGGDAPPADILFLTNTRAAISQGDRGVYIIDFADVLTPTLLGVLTADSMIAINMFLDGTVLYVAGYSGGLYLFDVSTYFATPLPAAAIFLATGGVALGFIRRKTGK